MNFLPLKSDAPASPKRGFIAGREQTFICVFAASLVCFGLQLNLVSLFAFFHQGQAIVRLTPYFFLGCAVSPLILWTLRRYRLESILNWITPFVLSVGALGVQFAVNEPLAKMFLVTVLGSSYAVLLSFLFKEEFKWTYFADLSGGIIAFILTTYFLPQLTGEGIYLLILAVSFFPASISAGFVYRRILARVLGLICLALFAAQLAWSSFDLLRLLPSRSFMGDSKYYASSLLKMGNGRLLGSRWSAISRVDAVEDVSTHTTALFYNDRPWSLLTPHPTMRYVFLGPIYQGLSSALLVGVGGGNDIRALEQAGLKEITSVEVNDATVALMNGNLRTVSQNIYQKSAVILSDGRAYLEATEKNFDLILVASADLYSPHLQGNVSLESYLYTKEAMDTYFKHLNPNGMVVITRHLRDDSRSNDSIRLLHTIESFLFSKGLPLADHLEILSHNMESAISNPRRIAFLLHKTALTAQKKREHARVLRETPGIAWLSEKSKPGTVFEFSIERLLNSTFLGLSAEPHGGFELVTTDSRPFFALGDQQSTISMFANIPQLLPLLMCLLLAVFYLLTPVLSPAKSANAAQFSNSTNALLLSLLSGVAFGFLVPFFYHHFLVYSRAPLVTLGLVQLGALAAAIFANLAHDTLRRGKIAALFTLAIALISGLHFFWDTVFAKLRPSELGYNLLILGCIFPAFFTLGLVFPSAVERVSGPPGDDGSFILEGIFGINLAGLGIGAFLSLLCNVVWGLNVSYAALLSLPALILFVQSRKSI
jgi:spermidine synthase